MREQNGNKLCARIMAFSQKAQAHLAALAGRITKYFPSATGPVGSSHFRHAKDDAFVGIWPPDHGALLAFAS